MYTRFPNRNMDCFGSSLANYFEINDESQLAEKVYGEFRDHPFVASDGSVRALLCTRLVHDLTGGTYHGKFQYLSFKKDTQESLERDIGGHAAEALKAIDEELRDGRLVGGLDRISYRGQALILQSLPTRELQHWLVDCDDGTIINNGEVRSISDSALFFATINAVLQIYKV